MAKKPLYPKTSKKQVLRCKIRPRSDEEVAINYLFMRFRSSNKSITYQNLFDLAPNRFKELSNAKLAVDNLVLYKYAETSDQINFTITELGFKSVYILAEHRKNKSIKLSDKD